MPRGFGQPGVRPSGCAARHRLRLREGGLPRVQGQPARHRRAALRRRVRHWSLAWRCGGVVGEGHAAAVVPAFTVTWATTTWPSCKPTQLVDGIEPSAKDFKAAGDALCEPCVKAKHHKISRGPSNTSTNNPLELVHMDVCGPFQEASLGGSMYLVL